jgi:hypothetical protein
MKVDKDCSDSFTCNYKVYCLQRGNNRTSWWMGSILLCIWEGPDWNLVTGTGYHETCLSWVSSVALGSCQDNTSTQITTSSFHILSNSLFSNHSTVYRLIGHGSVPGEYKYSSSKNRVSSIWPPKNKLLSSLENGSGDSSWISVTYGDRLPK